MKIAQLISSYLPHVGGAEICIHNIASRFVRDGHEVSVITPRTSERKNALGYNIIDIPRSFASWTLRRRLLAERLFNYYLDRMQQKYVFDIWQVTMGYPFALLAADFFARKNIPAVLRCSGEDIQTDAKIGYGYRLDPHVDALVRKQYPKYDAFVGISLSVANEYRALGIEDKKITIISNGVDFERFRDTPSQDFVHKKYALHAKKKVILTVGRNHPKKGYALIPEIARHLMRLGDDFAWVIIGKDSSRVQDLPGFSEVAQFFFLEESVCPREENDHTLVPSQELIAYYGGADVFLFPSYVETFGIVLLEAMAAGLPIVTTDAPGCRDVVHDGETGTLARVGDARDMAEKLHTLLHARDLQEKYRMNGLRIAEKNDWSMIAKQYLRLYLSLL